MLNMTRKKDITKFMLLSRIVCEILLFACISLVISSCNSDNQLREYDEQNVLIKTFYKDANGKLHGECCLYYRDGSLQEKFYYDHGKLSGLYRKYDEDGELTMEGRYKLNLMVGEFKTFYRGQLVEKEFYNLSGQRVSRYKYSNRELSKREFYYIGTGKICSSIGYLANKEVDSLSRFITLENFDEKSIKIRFHNNLITKTDSLVVIYLKRFSDNKYIDYKQTDILLKETYKLNSLGADIKLKDNLHQGKLYNVMFEVYGKSKEINNLIVDFPLQWNPKKGFPKNNLSSIEYGV